jgi:hypothetical protein
MQPHPLSEMMRAGASMLDVREAQCGELDREDNRLIIERHWQFERDGQAGPQALDSGACRAGGYLRQGVTRE